MRSAKEGGRTPTRVTSLEPERIGRVYSAGKNKGVGASGCHQEAAENITNLCDSGARTTIPTAEFLRVLAFTPGHTQPLDLASADDSGEWSTVPVARKGLATSAHALDPAPVRLPTLYWPRLS